MSEKNDTKRPFPPFCENEENMPIGHLVKIVEHTYGQSVRVRLEKIGIQRAFGPVLTELSRSEGLSQGELADRMFFKPSSVSVTIQKMEEMGLIRREQHETDARQVRIFLTDEGRATVIKIKEAFDGAEKEMASKISPKELSELRRILLKLKEFHE